jgi:hypothetical protein
MKVMNYTAWLVSLMLAAGCATTFRPWKLSDVQAGMERAQVVDILGEPDAVETKDGAEILHYAYRENYNPPLADDSVHARGNSLGLQEKQLRDSAREYHYVVRMVDGKVMDYKELND